MKLLPQGATLWSDTWLASSYTVKTRFFLNIAFVCGKKKLKMLSYLCVDFKNSLERIFVT